MAKIRGKITKFYFGDKGTGWTEASLVPLKSASIEQSFNEIDVTDTGSDGDSAEVLTGLASRSVKIECNLKSASGKAVKGKGMTLVFDGQSVPSTSISFEESYNEIDVTDNATSGDGTETLVGLAKRTSKVSAWIIATVADLVLAIEKTATLTFATGISVTGDAIILSKSTQGEVNGAAKNDYTISWNSVTKTFPTTLQTGIEKDFKLVLRAGTSVDRAFEGKAVINNMSITADAKADIKVSYTLKINGALTETLDN